MAEVIASTYELIREIGSGGGGVVYLARHLRLGKYVVLKADKRKLTTRPELLRREVDVLKDLTHPYIPQVYDFFVENGTVYTAMAYIEGESLDKPLKRGEKYSQPQVIKWARQLLEALCYLHSPTHGNPPRGYVHSDIKPANLMRTPDNNICLIDFNIALALGEENVIGCSIGYASPEHYGLDFSTDGETQSETMPMSVNGNGTATLSIPVEKEMTETMPMDVMLTETMSVLTGGEKGGAVSDSLSDSSSSRKKVIIPDVRSDIYSVGATLYHLLSGRRPARNAKEVIPLSEKEFSPLIVAIISKAMNPNPDLRYQTAAEMLEDFSNLHEKDPRMVRLKRQRLSACVFFGASLAVSVLASFIGLKRMQTAESWLKLAEYSQNAMAEGDAEKAIDYALNALPEKTGLLRPAQKAEAQKALTDALGVYDLSDSYKTHALLELPSAPFFVTISPDGKTGCCVYAYEVAVFDTDTAGILVTLPAMESALAEAEYLDDRTIVYAGKEGVTVYDIAQDIVLWIGEPATSVAVSGNGEKIAAVYKDETRAIVYDARSGEQLYQVDFSGRHQRVTVNDHFANPNDNLLALDQNGFLLGVSFEDGSLELFSLDDSRKNVSLLETGSGYTHFEGGFCRRYFAFSASSQTESAFAVVDTADMCQTGGFETEGFFGVQANGSGIWLQADNVLVQIDPVTGEQIPQVNTFEKIRCFAKSDSHTLITTEEAFLFFDRNAIQIARTELGYGTDFAQIAGDTALIGSRDKPALRILKYENHSEAELFTYDPARAHDEARISADGRTVMLFSYAGFLLYTWDGELLAEVSIPNEKQVYDQQYIRDEEGSRLEVTYNDGTIRAYSAVNGEVQYEKQGDRPDAGFGESFTVGNLRIESPLHGTPAAYDVKSGRLVRELEKDAYLTYVTQAGEYIVVQYVTADGYCYGQLLNDRCELLADLPYLCDVIEERLIFDYPTGNMRESHIYDIGELISIAQKKKNGGKAR